MGSKKLRPLHVNNNESKHVQRFILLFIVVQNICYISSLYACHNLAEDQ